MIALLTRSRHSGLDGTHENKLLAIKVVVISSAAFFVAAAFENDQAAVKLEFQRLFHFDRPAADGKRKPGNFAGFCIQNKTHQATTTASKGVEHILAGKVRFLACRFAQASTKFAVTLFFQDRLRGLAVVEIRNAIILELRQ